MKNNIFNDYLSRFSLFRKDEEKDSDTINANDLIEESVEKTEEKKTSNITKPIFNKTIHMQTSDASTISQDMVITGSLESTNNIRILGTILGNVSSKGDVSITGKVEGDIFANNLNFDSPNLTGNITVTDTTKISEASTINGNIVTQNVYIGGTINGNISATGHTALLKSAVVTGNIDTNSLEIASGAIINGKITIKR